MASSLFINTLNVCFESVLAMDNAGMVAMFESFVDTGLKGFLGCPAVIHEAAVLEFFANGSVRDGFVVSTVNRVTVEFSEQLFAETFELPVEGLTYLSEIPKDLVFDARSIVSLSEKKKEMAIEFRLLCDILAKTISVKVGSFDAITQEKFLMMAAITCGVRINWNRLLFNIFKDMVTPGSRQAKGYAIQISLLLENVPNLELGESSEFPSSKVLTENTMHRYIVLNDKVGMEVVKAEPRVKKTPVKRAASKKRPATDAAVAPVVKKKRTTKTTPVPKRKIQKRKRRLILGSDDEIVDSEPVVGGSIVGEAAVEVVDDTAEKDVETVVDSVGISDVETAIDSVIVETVVGSADVPVSLPAMAVVLNEGISTADEVDIIIEQVIAETAQIDTDVGDQDVVTSEVGDKTSGTADEFELWFNLSSEEIQARLDADRPIETASDTDEEFIADQVFGTGVEKMETETVEQTADEAMSLEDILITIPVDCPLPSAGVEVTKIILGGTISIPRDNEGDWYKASLPKISAADKGKAPLLERDPAKGNPIQEQFSLILADIEVLVMLQEQIIDEVEKFFNSFNLKRNFLEARKINFTPGEGSSATDLKVMEILSDLHLFAVEELKEQTMAHGLKWEKMCCSKIFEGRPRDRGAIIARTNTNTRSRCWIRTMIRVDGVWLIEPCGDHWVKIPQEVVNNEISRQRSYDDTIPPISVFFKLMKNQWGDVCLEVAQFSVSSKLLPVGSLNFCRTLAVVEPVSVFVSRQSPVISRRDVQIVQCSVSAIPSVQSSFASADRSYVQLLLYQRPQSPSTTADSSMHFVEDDIQLEYDFALDHFISTSSATIVTTSIVALPESFSNFVATQSKDSRQTNNALVEVMNTIDHVKRFFLDSIVEHNETFWGLFKRSRQEAQNDNNALSLALKAVRNQNVILSIDLEATRKEVRDIKAALSKNFDDKLADIRNELLEFRVETQGQLASLGTHLAELIAFLTKGSDDKKGEGISSRPQPPPENQSRPSGGNGGSGNRAEEQSRYRGGSRSRGDRSGSSKRRYSSSGGGPFRRSFEDCLG
ncbi:hypothetical protein F511_27968 [Dorcoceras hygrometricum]|uniref:Dystroglycan-like n=1 Tax=Dorcoceras hygrometricum TaxID=472368 RepID=A0A2Z7D0V2_9LAMI|nr:hypothetical protein F511_27968 [Dorcoceras hygrometricum]